MTLLATLSGAERAHICTGSTALAKVGSVGGASGSVQHEAIALMISEGREAMLAKLSDICARWGVDEREEGFVRAKMHKFAPPIPKRDDSDEAVAAFVEVGLCLLANGDVVEVSGGRGQYVVPDNAIIAGSIDVMWSEPEPLRLVFCEPCLSVGYVNAPPDQSPDDVRRCDACNGFRRRVECPAGTTLWIADWKTGDDSNVSRADRNRQILWAAALAAKWTGAERVMPALCFADFDSMPEGRWDMRRRPGAWPGAPLRPRPYDRDELATIEAEIMADHRAWVDQARRYTANEPLSLTTGAHCEHCPAKGACPAWVAPVRALIAVDPARLAKGALMHDEAVSLALVLPTARKAVDAADEALRVYAERNGPVALPDGRVYGPQVQPFTDKTFATRATYEVLAEEIGPENADLAFYATKGSIEESIRLAHEKSGIKRQGRSTMGRVMAKLKEANAITESPVVWMKAHHPVDKE